MGENVDRGSRMPEDVAAERPDMEGGNDLKYEYWMASLYRISDNRRRQSCLICGGAEKLYRLSENEMRRLHYFTEEEIHYIRESRKGFDIEGEWERLRQKEIRFLPCSQEEYPARLRHIYDPPYALYVKGSLPDAAKKSVAVVGARACSEYGRGVARLLGKTLAEHGVPVISGLAIGIDSASHAGALSAGGDTFAVLGSGCDVCYPRTSANLYLNILSGSGGILSELAPGTQPLPQFFPRRNRIISALADVVVVVEAKKRSGSLITADCAIDQGKDVFAVPGRFRDSLSEGCNHLIEQGAGILYDIENFLKNTGIVSDSEIMEKKLDKLSLAKEERLVYSNLDFNPKFIDMIIEETGLNLLTVLHALDFLKKKQLVQETFQNYFCKIL
ncbi:MAG: DNA-processing protein DprA [Clostridiales bacterium]|nr:DNA-processing protein DprA [Clostridiales bacterium]